jgi:hypothetical protein
LELEFLAPFFASLHLYYINTTKSVKGLGKVFFEVVNALPLLGIEDWGLGTGKRKVFDT